MSAFSSAALCVCGCGLPAPLSRQSDTKRGYVKGQPLRFRVGHNHRPGRTDGRYPHVYKPDHPRAMRTGCVMIHVLVAERALGRYLPRTAEIHHVDGDKGNYANRNLVICQDHAYHFLLHARARTVKAGGDPNTQKFCADCRQCREFAEFNQRRGGAFGLQSVCRECQGRRWDQRRKSRAA